MWPKRLGAVAIPLGPENRFGSGSQVRGARVLSLG